MVKIMINNEQICFIANKFCCDLICIVLYSDKQVKELGLFFVNCEPLAADLNKIFAMYSYLGDNGTPPQQWPKEFVTQYNIANPMTLILNSIPARVYIAVSMSMCILNAVPKPIFLTILAFIARYFIRQNKQIAVN